MHSLKKIRISIQTQRIKEMQMEHVFLLMSVCGRQACLAEDRTVCHRSPWSWQRPVGFVIIHSHLSAISWPSSSISVSSGQFCHIVDNILFGYCLGSERERERESSMEWMRVSVITNLSNKHFQAPLLLNPLHSMWSKTYYGFHHNMSFGSV